MRRAKFLRIAREGWPFIGLAVVFGYLVAAAFGLWWALPFLLLLGGLAVFFYDRARPVPPGSLAVIAPVDGTIVHRRECYDPFLDREAIRISIDVACFGAYMLRSPVAGMVLEMPPSACPDTAGTVSWIRTNEGHDVVLTVAEGTMFGARPCQTPFGERVGQGRCCGQRRLARRLDVYVPPNSRVEVAQGATVHAGADVIAKFVRKHNGNGNGDSALD